MSQKVKLAQVTAPWVYMDYGAGSGVLGSALGTLAGEYYVLTTNISGIKKGEILYFSPENMIKRGRSWTYPKAEIEVVGEDDYIIWGEPILLISAVDAVGERDVLPKWKESHLDQEDPEYDEVADWYMKMWDYAKNLDVMHKGGLGDEFDADLAVELSSSPSSELAMELHPFEFYDMLKSGTLWFVHTRTTKFGSLYGSTWGDFEIAIEFLHEAQEKSDRGEHPKFSYAEEFANKMNQMTPEEQQDYFDRMTKGFAQSYEEMSRRSGGWTGD